MAEETRTVRFSAVWEAELPATTPFAGGDVIVVESRGLTVTSVFHEVLGGWTKVTLADALPEEHVMEHNRRYRNADVTA